jgi:hypothetical protein
MNFSDSTKTTFSVSVGRVSALRDELSARRRARAARLDLRRELASYTTPREVDDLLALIDDLEVREADTMRRLLTQTIHRDDRLPFAS